MLDYVIRFEAGRLKVGTYPFWGRGAAEGGVCGAPGPLIGPESYQDSAKQGRIDLDQVTLRGQPWAVGLEGAGEMGGYCGRCRESSSIRARSWR